MAQRTVITPSDVVASVYLVVRNVQFLSPYPNRLGLPSGGYADITPLVATLVRTRGPSNVTWLVMTVIVDTVNRVMRAGSATNLSQKLVKRSEAKLNFSSAIVFEGCVLRIFASLFSVDPCYVLWAPFWASRLTVFNSIFRQIDLKASTRLATSERRNRNLSDHAAVTQTKPFRDGRLIDSLSCIAQECPPAATLSGAIAKIRSSGMWLKNNIFNLNIFPYHLALFYQNKAYVSTQLCEI